MAAGGDGGKIGAQCPINGAGCGLLLEVGPRVATQRRLAHGRGAVGVSVSILKEDSTDTPKDKR